MFKRTLKVFVSYSHEDRDVVVPVVTLLRAMQSDVFLDFQSIAPTRDWAADVLHALYRADVVVTFWCAHSSGSKHVELEWQTGLRAGKRLLPVLLDDTALPEALGRYQGIDFRSLVKDSHPGQGGESQSFQAINPFAIFLFPLLVIWMLIWVPLQSIFDGRIEAWRERRRHRRYLKMVQLLGERIVSLSETDSAIRP